MINDVELQYYIKQYGTYNRKAQYYSDKQLDVESRKYKSLSIKTYNRIMSIINKTNYAENIIK